MTYGYDDDCFRGSYGPRFSWEREDAETYIRGSHYKSDESDEIRYSEHENAKKRHEENIILCLNHTVGNIKGIKKIKNFGSAADAHHCEMVDRVERPCCYLLYVNRDMNDAYCHQQMARTECTDDTVEKFLECEKAARVFNAEALTSSPSVIPTAEALTTEPPLQTSVMLPFASSSLRSNEGIPESDADFSNPPFILRNIHLVVGLVICILLVAARFLIIVRHRKKESRKGERKTTDSTSLEGKDSVVESRKQSYSIPEPESGSTGLETEISTDLESSDNFTEHAQMASSGDDLV